MLGIQPKFQTCEKQKNKKKNFLKMEKRSHGIENYLDAT